MAYFSISALSSLIEQSSLELPTSIELLKLVYSNEHIVAEIHDTFGDDIVSRLAEDQTPPGDASTSQILFMTSARDNGCTTNQLRASKATLRRICAMLGVQYAFLEAVLIPSIWSKQSGASFHRYNRKGESIGIDGFYHYFNEWHLGPLHVWFSYNLQAKLTTYLLIDCPQSAKDLITGSVENQQDCFIHQPFAIDYLIAEHCAMWREKLINEHWKQLFVWNDTSRSGMDPPIKQSVRTLPGLQSLHELSRTFNMIYEDLGDFCERCDLMIVNARKLEVAGMQQSQQAIESFQFLQARNNLRRRWVTSFAERTKLVINFVFSDASQENGQTNLQIAKLTTTIAREAQIDTSSMITIATMTMLFLPGTFVSAIFSMAFFNYSTGEGDGKESFSVSSRFWLFPAVTVPMTILVFVLFSYWRRMRGKGKTPIEFS